MRPREYEDVYIKFVLLGAMTKDGTRDTNTNFNEQTRGCRTNKNKEPHMDELSYSPRSNWSVNTHGIFDCN